MFLFVSLLKKLTDTNTCRRRRWIRLLLPFIILNFYWKTIKKTISKTRPLGLRQSKDKPLNTAIKSKALFFGISFAAKIKTVRRTDNFFWCYSYFSIRYFLFEFLLIPFLRFRTIIYCLYKFPKKSICIYNNKQTIWHSLHSGRPIYRRIFFWEKQKFQFRIKKKKKNERKNLR